jgi:DNA-binding HxlR family transcriptional regulator
MRDHYRCSMEVTADLICGEWKLMILCNLVDGTMRFNELQKRLPGISHRVLAKQLRQLETDGLVIRKVYPEVPSRVEYSLTDLGTSLDPILEQLFFWGRRYAQQFQLTVDHL